MYWRQWGILALSFGFLFFILTTPMSRLAVWQHFYSTPEKNAEVITPKEVNAFLDVWPEFLQTNAANGEASQLSLANGKASEVLSPSLKRWFEVKGWDVDRFFYVEQRLRAIIKTEMLLSNIQNNKKLLEKGRDSNLKNIINEQERQVNAEKVSTEELEMIRPVLYKVSKILEAESQN